MFNDATKQAILSAVRSLLIVLGTSLSARGIISADGVNEIVGAAMVLIPIIWGVWDKYSAEHATQKREMEALQVGAKIGPLAQNASLEDTQTLIKQGATP